MSENTSVKRKPGRPKKSDIPAAKDPDIPVKRKRGRPKGTKDKQQRKIRKDNTQFIIPENDRIKIIKFNRYLLSLGRISDRNNYDVVFDRIQIYLQACESSGIMPTVAGLALALGIDRATLWTWINNTQGAIKNQGVIDILKSVYSFINTQYEELLTEGKMIPVSAFFLMQNNHGYKQQTDHVITASNDNNIGLPDITTRAGLLDE